MAINELPLPLESPDKEVPKPPLKGSNKMLSKQNSDLTEMPQFSFGFAIVV